MSIPATAPMNQILLVLITAVVTGAVSISGIWLGSRLTRQNESQKWRRDRCLEAYSELVRVVELVRHESDICYLAKECGTEEHTKQAEIVFLKMAEMNRIATGLRLLMPRMVQDKIWELTFHVGDEIVTKSITCPKVDRSEVGSARAKSSKLIIDFISAARNDLGVDLPLDTIEGVRQYYGNPWRQLWWWLLRVLWR
jgi:hypothetical protein